MKMPFSFSQCSFCSYGILQIVMTHVNNVFSAYFVLAQPGLCHLPLPLPLPTGFYFNMCRHYDFVSMMDYAFVACDSWTSSPSSCACLTLSVCPVGQHIESARPPACLTFHSTIFQLLPLNCVICGACYCTHTYTHTQVHRCAKCMEAWKRDYNHLIVAKLPTDFPSTQKENMYSHVKSRHLFVLFSL